MKYQIVVAGFGGQGIVFLVKVLSICSLNRGWKFLGTENHGMSQRGGTIVSDLKIGDFFTPMISYNQADLIIGLHADELLRVIQYLKPDGTIMVNSTEGFPKLREMTFRVDAYSMTEKKEFAIQALNVFMLGQVLRNINEFPFTLEELKVGIENVNPKYSRQNIKVFKLGLETESISL